MALKLSDLDPSKVQLIAPAPSAAPTAVPSGGLKLSQLDPSQVQAVPTPDDTPNALESGLRGIAQGASLGFGDEIEGAGQAVLDKILGSHPDQSLADLYRAHRDYQRAQNAKAEAAHPYIYGGGNLVGGLAPAMLTGGATEGATLGDLALQGAGLGAAMGVGGSNADLTKGDVGGVAKDAAIGAATGGVAGAVAPTVMEAAKGALGSVANLAGSGAKKVLSATLGPSTEAIDAYLHNPGAINNARGLEDIKNEVDNFVGGLRDQVDSKQMSLDQAKQALTEYKNQLWDSLKDQRGQAKDALDAFSQSVNDNFKDAKFAARDNLYDANQKLNQSYSSQVEGLKNSSITGLKDDIQDSVKQLKSQVRSLSGESYKALENAGGSIPTAPLLDTINQGLGTLVIKGQPVSDTAVGSYAIINKLKDRIANLGDEISMPEAKAILQQLDSDIDYSSSQQAGSFPPEADKIKSAVRSTLDQTLKGEVPEYNEVMQQLAPKAKLLSEASQSFGNDARAISRLNTIGSERGQAIDVPLLQQLGAATDKDFSTPIQQHLAKLDVLGSKAKLQALRESLPEFAPWKDADAAMYNLQDPANQRMISEMVDKSPQAAKLAETEQNLKNFDNTVASSTAVANLTQAGQDLESAQGAFEPYKNFSSQTTEAKLKALTQDRNNIELNRTFDKIQDQTGTDYRQAMKNLDYQKQFSGSYANGSRRAVTFGAAGSALGHLSGLPGGGYAGAAIGAAIGARADQQGGVWAKNVLDFYLDHNPSALGKYATPLMNAAKRGPAALAAAHFVLSQTDPSYREHLNSLQDNANGTPGQH